MYRLRVGILKVVVLGLLAVVVLMGFALVVLPAASPSTGARFADLLRAIVGVQPVADLESLSNRVRDEVNRYRFSDTVARPQISWSEAKPVEPASPPVPRTPPPSQTAQTGLPAPSTDVVTSAPQLGWLPFGPMPAGVPLMARALILVDPQRSYAGVALVRIDLGKVQLHIMPGTREPAHPSGIGQAIPQLGSIPSSERSNLVAAFNGGFKGIHGHYGMMVDGFDLLKPINGEATVAVYHDGSVRIGAWNRDILPSQDMTAYRQNCPPLIDAGVLNPALGSDASRAWGFTHNTDVTWRSGLGVTKDGRYLIYAVGNGTDVKFLAQALQEAGAYSAMQLDINQYYDQFDAYTQVNGQPVAQRLLDQMTDSPHKYLTPELRDFFYLTLN